MDESFFPPGTKPWMIAFAIGWVFMAVAMVAAVLAVVGWLIHS